MKALVLMHKDLVPSSIAKIKAGESQEGEAWEAEFDVVECLKKLGHEVLEIGVISDLKKIRQSVEEFKPKAIFNLLEEFNGEAIYDQNVVSYLELLGVSYTGCGPRGLMLSRDKALSKKIMTFHKIKTPKFQVFGRRERIKKLKLKSFPLIVKCLNEESSLGISTASKVTSEEKVYERVKYLQDQYHVDVVVEEFIEGIELYVGVIGNQRLQVLPVWQLFFDDVENPDKEIYSENAKYNKKYRARKGIRTGAAQISSDLGLAASLVAKKTYKALGLNGYARIDLRVNEQGDVYVLEANPNPDISKSDDFAQSAKKAGLCYQKLLTKILKLSQI